MEKNGLIKILLLTTVFSLSFAQENGQNTLYVSGMELVKSANPIDDQEHQFIYRMKVGKEKTHLLFDMNSLLMQEKYMYRWPKEYPSVEKPNASLFSGRTPIEDVIYNEKVILSDKQGLSLLFEGKKIKLENVLNVGVGRVGTGKQRVTKVFSDGLEKSSLGPVFSYTFKGKGDFLLIEEDYKVPEWIYVEVAALSYREVQKELKRLPNLPHLVETPNEAMDLQQIRDLLERQMRVDSQWIDSLRMNLIFFPERRVKEGDAEFEARKKIHLATIEKVLKNILPENWEANRYLIHHQMIAAKENENQQKELIQNLKIDKKDKLFEQWWSQSLSAIAQVLVGANLPKEATNPGPDAFLGASVGLSYTHLMGTQHFLFPHYELGGGYSQWKYNETVGLYSKHIWLGAKLGFVLPLITMMPNRLTSPYTGIAFVSRLGLQSQFSLIELGQRSESQSEMAIGGFGVLAIVFGQRGTSLEVEYHYLSNGYGGLGLNLNLPLWIGGLE